MSYASLPLTDRTFFVYGSLCIVFDERHGYSVASNDPSHQLHGGCVPIYANKALCKAQCGYSGKIKIVPLPLEWALEDSDQPVLILAKSNGCPLGLCLTCD